MYIWKKNTLERWYICLTTTIIILIFVLNVMVPYNSLKNAPTVLGVVHSYLVGVIPMQL